MLNVAIIGCGDMGTLHAAAWNARHDARIVLVCDADDGRRKILAEKYQAVEHAVWTDAIAHEGVNVVSICTPAYTHCDIAVASANAGKHVLCEKPIALTLAEASEMIAAAEANQTKLSVSHQYRGMGRYRVLKQLVDDEKLGSPLFMRFMDIREVRPKLAMHSAGISGGPVHDMSGHFFDLGLLFAQGEAVSVSAVGNIYAKDKRRVAGIHDLGIDMSDIQVRFKEGHCLSININWGMPEDTPGLSQTVVYGPKGVAYLEPTEPGDANIGDRNENCTVILKDGGGTHHFDCPPDPDGPDICIADLAQAIQLGKAPQFDGRTGRNILILILAAQESMMSGQTVFLNGPDQ